MQQGSHGGFFIGGRDEKRGRGGRDWPLNTGALEREEEREVAG